MIRSTQIEGWVLSIYDLVREGKKVEDSRVELKADWPDPKRAARRIAGHANAARGEPILWIIGLDEEHGVREVKNVEIADWYAQVKSQFSDISPSLQDVTVTTEDGVLTALVFDTARGPYLVKNPAGGRISREIPWREGTAVRTATRQDVIRLLIPRTELPSVEFLSGSVTIKQRDAVNGVYASGAEPIQREPHLRWRVSLEVYVTPSGERKVVLPVHKASLTLHMQELNLTRMPDGLRFSTPSIHTGRSFRKDSHTISTTQSEAVVDGPGKFRVSASWAEERWAVPDDVTIEVDFEVIPAGEERAIGLQVEFKPSISENDAYRYWVSDVEI